MFSDASAFAGNSLALMKDWQEEREAPGSMRGRRRGLSQLLFPPL